MHPCYDGALTAQAQCALAARLQSRGCAGGYDSNWRFLKWRPVLLEFEPTATRLAIGPPFVSWLAGMCSSHSEEGAAGCGVASEYGHFIPFYRQEKCGPITGFETGSIL